MTAPWQFATTPTTPRRPSVMLLVFGSGPLLDEDMIPLSLSRFGAASADSLTTSTIKTVPRDADTRWYDAWRSGSLRNIATQDLAPDALECVKMTKRTGSVDLSDYEMHEHDESCAHGEDDPPTLTDIINSQTSLSGAEIEALLVRCKRRMYLNGREQITKEEVSEEAKAFSPALSYSELALQIASAIVECSDMRFLPEKFRKLDRGQLQLVVQQITNRSTTDLMTDYVFQTVGMSRTSMVGRSDFDADHVTGYDERGKLYPPSRRESPDAVGSMTTTVRDWATLLAAVLRGELLPAHARDEMLRPQIRITSEHQFPIGSSAISHTNDPIQLSYGLGWGVFVTPYGEAYFKEGHDDGVQHYCITFDGARTAIVLMTNSDNGESMFKELLATLLGDTFTPVRWENYVPYNER